MQALHGSQPACAPSLAHVSAQIARPVHSQHKPFTAGKQRRRLPSQAHSRSVTSTVRVYARVSPFMGFLCSSRRTFAFCRPVLQAVTAIRLRSTASSQQKLPRKLSWSVCCSDLSLAVLAETHRMLCQCLLVSYTSTSPVWLTCK